MANQHQGQGQGQGSGRSGTRNRGFASMSQAEQREIARMGGEAVSEDREHMAAIGRRGGEASAQARAERASRNRAAAAERRDGAAGGDASSRAGIASGSEPLGGSDAVRSDASLFGGGSRRDEPMIEDEELDLRPDSDRSDRSLSPRGGDLGRRNDARDERR